MRLPRSANVETEQKEMRNLANYMERVRHALIFRWDNATVPIRLRCLGVTFRGRPRFVGVPLITLAPRSSIELCHNAMLISRPFATALGVSHPVILRTLSESAFIRIGEDTGLSGATICAFKSVTIGPSSMLGADVIVMDTDFHSLSSKGRRKASIDEARCASVEIGSNVFIGTRSIVLRGVNIGDNAVVGAGSVVTESIPENVVAGGNPCRVIRRLE